MLIEDALADMVRFFRIDALSSSVGLKVDFDNCSSHPHLRSVPPARTPNAQLAGRAGRAERRTRHARQYSLPNDRSLCVFIALVVAVPIGAGSETRSTKGSIIRRLPRLPSPRAASSHYLLRQYDPLHRAGEGAGPPRTLPRVRRRGFELLRLFPPDSTNANGLDHHRKVGFQIAAGVQNAARPHFRLPCRQNVSPSVGGATRSVP